MLDHRAPAARMGQAAAMLGVDFDMSLAQQDDRRNFADCSAMLRARYVTPYPVDARCSPVGIPLTTRSSNRRSCAETRRPRLLDWLEDVAIARRLTSTRRDRARAKLAQTTLLPRFHEVVGGDGSPYGKPAPDIYVEAARRLGNSPPRAWCSGFRARDARGSPPA